MPINVERGLTSGASGFLAGLQTGNPKVAAGLAAISAVSGALQEDPTIDDSKIQTALNRLEQRLMAQANRVSGEQSARLGQSFAQAGIRGAFKQGIIEGNRRATINRAMDFVADRRAEAELTIASAEQQQEQQNLIARNNRYAALAGNALQLGQRLGNPSAFDSPGIRELRENLNKKFNLGLHNVDPIDLEGIVSAGTENLNLIDIGGGIRVDRNSVAGQIYTTNKPLWDGFVSAWGGTIEDLINILGVSMQGGTANATN